MMKNHICHDGEDQEYRISQSRKKKKKKKLSTQKILGTDPDQN